MPATGGNFQLPIEKAGEVAASIMEGGKHHQNFQDAVTALSVELEDFLQQLDTNSAGALTESKANVTKCVDQLLAALQQLGSNITMVKQQVEELQAGIQKSWTLGFNG